MKMRTVAVILVGFLVALEASPSRLLAARPPKSRGKVVIPARAVEVAPNVFYLGRAKDKGRTVEGYAIVTPKQKSAKPPCDNDGVCEPGEKKNCPDCKQPDNGTDTSGCHTFLARGAKWKTLEPYVVNPENTRGVDPGSIVSILASSIDKWELAAEADILGSGEVTPDTLAADTESPDNLNEVYFADVDQAGAIAITIVWGIFSGPPRARELVEWDQVYDDVDFDWSDDGSPGKMDFENIATHELGHSVGLGDLYDTKCSEQTMYGYASLGETKKRTLEDGDIEGVHRLYR